LCVFQLLAAATRPPLTVPALAVPSPTAATGTKYYGAITTVDSILCQCQSGWGFIGPEYKHIVYFGFYQFQTIIYLVIAVFHRALLSDGK